MGSLFTSRTGVELNMPMLAVSGRASDREKMSRHSQSPEALLFLSFLLFSFSLDSNFCPSRPTDQFPRPSGSPLRPPFKGGDLPSDRQNSSKGVWSHQGDQEPFFLLCFFLAPHGACGILVPPNQGSNPCSLQWKQSLNHWAAREVSQEPFLNLSCYMFSIRWRVSKNVLRSFIRHHAVCLATLL